VRPGTVVSLPLPVLALVVGLLAPPGLACRRASGEPLLTYFNAEYGLSLRYPSSWKSEQGQREGIFYRHFLGPPAGPQSQPAVSATLLAGPLLGSLEEYAKTYVADNTLISSRDENRQGAHGRSYVFTASDGSIRHSLLLLQEKEKVYGLHSQADTPLFERHSALLEEMAKSFCLERPAYYEEFRDDAHGVSLRVPPSWQSGQSLSGSAVLLRQFRSPAIGADGNRETVHGSLTLTVEPIPGGGDVEVFYGITRSKLGDAFPILSHEAWRGGYVDMMRSETPLTVSRVKRFYRASAGRGYSLAFEARDDVFARVSSWCDLIASTLKIGPELNAP